MNRLEILGTGCTLRSQMRPPKCWRGDQHTNPRANWEQHRTAWLWTPKR